MRGTLVVAATFTRRPVWLPTLRSRPFGSSRGRTERALLDSEPYMVVSLDTLIIVGAFVVAAIYLVAQAVAGVNLACLHEARRIAAEALRDEAVVSPLLAEQQDAATRDRAVIERLIADLPSSAERALHTERRGSP